MDLLLCCHRAPYCFHSLCMFIAFSWVLTYLIVMMMYIDNRTLTPLLTWPCYLNLFSPSSLSLTPYPSPFIIILLLSPIPRPASLLFFFSIFLTLQFLQAILSPVHVVSHTAAQILAAYGAVDTERGDWPTLLPALLNNIANPEVAVQPKVSSLEVCTHMLSVRRFVAFFVRNDGRFISFDLLSSC